MSLNHLPGCLPLRAPLFLKCSKPRVEACHPRAQAWRRVRSLTFSLGEAWTDTSLDYVSSWLQKLKR